jgi:hypothetical protein
VDKSMTEIKRIQKIKILVSQKIHNNLGTEYFFRHILFSLATLDWDKVFELYLQEFPEENLNLDVIKLQR